MVYAIAPFDAYPASAAFVGSVASVLWSYAGAPPFHLPQDRLSSFLLSPVRCHLGHALGYGGLRHVFRYPFIRSGLPARSLWANDFNPSREFRVNRSWVFTETSQPS